MIGSRIQSGITKDELIKFIRDSRNPRIEAISGPKPADQSLIMETVRKLPTNKSRMLIFIHF